ncbi:MAG: DUF4465 domain-containing protein [Planctomycetes bacterium]|nr:DUF4465 domain-containing protein [Planctomycetota bacterium]
MTLRTLIVTTLAAGCLWITLPFSSETACADIVDFEELNVYSVGSGGLYYKGDKGNGTFNNDGWTSRGVHFSNYYANDLKWGPYWGGSAYSKVNNSTTGGYENQFAARPGLGSNGSSQYAIFSNGYRGEAVITFGAQVNIKSFDISNTSYAYYSMKNGDSWAKKFGGDSGNDADFFKLSIQGYRANALVGTVDFYLADYRFSDTSQDYILGNWQTVGLSSLGVVDSLQFSLESSDNDPLFGMNTPAYFAMDGLQFSSVPEPGAIALLVSVAAAGVLRKRFKKRSTLEVEEASASMDAQRKA